MEAGQDGEDCTPAGGRAALPQVAVGGSGAPRLSVMCWQNTEGQSLGHVDPKD